MDICIRYYKWFAMFCKWNIYGSTFLKFVNANGHLTNEKTGTMYLVKYWSSAIIILQLLWVHYRLVGFIVIRADGTPTVTAFVSIIQAPVLSHSTAVKLFSGLKSPSCHSKVKSTLRKSTLAWDNDLTFII